MKRVSVLILSGVVPFTLLQLSTLLNYVYQLVEEPEAQEEAAWYPSSNIYNSQHADPDITVIRHDNKNDVFTTNVMMLQSLKEEQEQEDEEPLGNRRLEFVHITKTGGSAIERAAGLAGMTWGICHFERQHEVCGSNGQKRNHFHFKSLQLLDVASQFQNIEPWHTPHFWFKDAGIYRNANVFVVVRNPYDRILSEFYCKYFGYNRNAHARMREGGADRRRPRSTHHWMGPLKRVPKQQQGQRKLLGTTSIRLRARQHFFKKQTPETLNRWIQQQLLRGYLGGKTAHLMPQNFYVFGPGGKQMVSHVLRYESLQKEFRELMKLYNLPVVLPAEFVNAGAAEAGSDRLTVQDLNRDTIDMINRFYKDDFRLLGYEMMEA